MRMLILETIPLSAAEALRNEGHDAVHTEECGLVGASARAVKEFADREDRIIFAEGRDFLCLLF
jgi:predicted nuclease of predicted toxin-antitoxin system